MRLTKIFEYAKSNGYVIFTHDLDLVLAGIENFAEHSTEDDFLGQARLTEQQAELLRHLFLRLVPKL
jgi:hypothetical protein